MKKQLLTIVLLFGILSFGYGQVQYNNFENSNNLPVLIEPGTDTLWHIGQPSKNSFSEAFSLPSAIITDSVNTYPIDQSTWFELELDESTLWYWPEIQLDWWYKIDCEQGVDGGVIEVSYDDGQTWKNVFSDPDFQPEMVGTFEIDTLFNGQVGITGVTTDWSWMAICWGNYFGELPSISDNIKIRYNFFSDSNDTQQDGWMMDSFGSETQIVGSTSDQRVRMLDIFPNPTTHALYADLSEINQSEIEIRIYNYAGQLVATENLNGSMDNGPIISTKHLVAGMYNILIETEDSIFRASFVKID